jgi:stage V sporulation protein B
MSESVGFKGVKSGFFWLVAGNATLFLSGFAVYIVLGKFILTPAEFGIYGLIISLATVFTVIFKNSFLQTTSHFVSIETKNAFSFFKKIFSLQLAVSMLLFIVFYFFAENIALLFGDASLSKYIVVISFVFPFSSIYAVALGYLNGLKKFSSESIIQISYNLLKVFLVIGLAVLGFGVYGSVGGFVLASAGVLAVVALFIHKNRTKGKSSVSMLVICKYVFPLTFLSVFLQLFYSTDLFFIKTIIGDNYSVGLYVAAQTISQIPNMVVLAIPFLIYPFVSEAHGKKDTGSIGKISRNSLKYSIMFLVLSLALVCSSSGELLSLLFNSNYVPASAALIMLSIGMAFFGLSSVLVAIITSTKRVALPIMILFLSIASDAALNIFLIPVYGLAGAAASTMIASVICFSALSFFVSSKFEGMARPASLAKIIPAGATIFAASYFLQFSGILLLAKFFVLSAIFVALMILLGELNLKKI